MFHQETKFKNEGEATSYMTMDIVNLLLILLALPTRYKQRYIEIKDRGYFRRRVNSFSMLFLMLDSHQVYLATKLLH